MESSGTPALFLPSRTNQSSLLLQKDGIRSNIWPKFMKRTNMPNLVNTQVLQLARPIELPSNSVRYGYQKIYSWLRRSKTILEVRKKATLLYVIKMLIIDKFFKDFINHRKKTNRAMFLAVNLSPNILKQKPTLRLFNNLENKIPSDTY